MHVSKSATSTADVPTIQVLLEEAESRLEGRGNIYDYTSNFSQVCCEVQELHQQCSVGVSNWALAHSWAQPWHLPCHYRVPAEGQ